MELKYLEALHAAIEIWDDRANGNKNYSGCPLCDVFKEKGENPIRGCPGCPIFEVFGRCDNTPYRQWADAETIEEETAAAKLEVALLRSLLPKDETKEDK